MSKVSVKHSVVVVKNDVLTVQGELADLLTNDELGVLTAEYDCFFVLIGAFKIEVYDFCKFRRWFYANLPILNVKY